MANIEKELLALKEQALQATKASDSAFYEEYLDDDAIAVVPFGVFDKKAIVKQMSSPNPAFRSSKVEDTRVFPLTPDSGLVTYRARYGEKDVLVTTVYAKRNGRWKGVFYQQTPLTPQP
jgi:hypothetical protein